VADIGTSPESFCLSIHSDFFRPGFRCLNFCKLTGKFKMKDFLKTAAGYIIVAVVSVLAGFSISLNFTAHQPFNIEIKWREEVVFALKKLRFDDCDLKKISEQEAKSMIVKIKNLPYDNPLSIDLRELRDEYKGPFKTKDVKVVVKFAEENNKITKGWAAACRECQLLNKTISIYKGAEPDRFESNRLEMRTFSIGVPQTAAICDDKNIEKDTIWISRDSARDWLSINDNDLPSQVVVKASILGRIAYN
jgi:hypothetical protein